MSDFIEKLKAQLDQEEPNWAVEWATGQELRNYAMNISRSQRGADEVRAMSQLRASVSQRLFHRILHASLGAGIIREVEDEHSSEGNEISSSKIAGLFLKGERP